MKQLKFKISGLECASCASQIEEASLKINGVNATSIDLMQYNVNMQVDESVRDSDIFKQFNIIADKIEPGAALVAENDHDHADKGSHALLRIISASILLVIGLMIKENDVLSFAFLITSYLTVGYDVLILAFKNIIRGKALDENFLMGIATVGAFLINERFEAVLVMLLYQLGEYLQDKAVNESKKSIANLMDIKPDFAMKLVDGQEYKVDPDSIMVGDIIVVRPGEKIPLDGKVINGIGSIDTKALTGESLPQDVQVGSDVLSGAINIDGVLEIEVSKAYFESTVKQILDLVENASANKAPAEKFIARFAKYYTPVVVVLALIIAFVVPLVTQGVLYDYSYIYKALTFLVISCPCALVISVPLSFFGGIGGASKVGILFKGSNYIEALSKAENVLFDKTGTLTEGNFAVTDIVTEYDKAMVIEYAAMAEYYSNHPIAKSIVNEYGKEIDINELSQAEEIAHHGVGVVYKGSQVWSGNYKLMQLKEIEVSEYVTDKSVIYLAIDDKFIGVIIIADEIKQEAYLAINNLRDLGIKDIEMVTGDNQAIASDVARELGLDVANANLTPVDKVNIVERFLDRDESVVFVGDGINDAPVLTMASVGVAMGGLGSDAAIEAADIVIMDDNPNKLPIAIKHSRRTMRIVKQNIVFALATKFLFLILGTLGISSMAMAVFADVGVSLLAILNALRLLRVR